MLNRKKTGKCNMLTGVYRHVAQNGSRYFMLLLGLSASAFAIKNFMAPTPDMQLNYGSGTVDIPTPPLPPLDFNQYFSDLCHVEPFPAANRGAKYNMVEYGFNYIPELCKDELEAGISESKECRKATSLNLYLTETRVAYDRDLDEYRAILTPKLKKLFSEMELSSPDEQEEAKNLILSYENLLCALAKYKLRGEAALAHNVGNCGESSSLNLYQILKKSAQYDLNVKLQTILYTNNTTDHLAILIDSDVENREITDPEEMKKFLADLKNHKGKICDSWNEGKLIPLSEALTDPLYTSAEVSVRVSPVSINIPDSRLGKKFADFLNTELKALGLKNLQGKPYFSLYAAADKKPVAAENDTPKLKKRLGFTQGE